MEKMINDPELGTITIRRGSRYRQYSLKVSEGKILATMPEWGDEKRMFAFINESRKRLLDLLIKHPQRSLLDENTELQTASFRLIILREERKKIGITLANEVLTIRFPAHIDISKDTIQTQLQEILKNVYRREAKRLLPGRIERLAQQYGFTYSTVKINSSRTRWGSCNRQKGINLSLYLMRLPWHLIDYVLLHELCHTKEMNHSPRFWALMDGVTENRAKLLRKELKGYH